MEEVDLLLEHLRSVEPETRGAAIESLSSVKSPAIISALVDVLSDEHITNRQKAADILLRHGEDSVEPLIHGLNHHDDQTKFHIVQLLGKIADSRALEPLLHLSQNSAGPLQYELLEALSNLNDEQTIPVFIQALSDQQQTVRDVAAKSLIKMQSQSIPALIAGLTNEQWMIRRMAAQILGKIGNPQAISHLIETLQYPDSILKMESARALGLMNTTRAVPALLPLIADPDTGVQRSAIEALAQIKDPRAIAPLLKALKIIDWKQRAILTEAVARIGPDVIQASIDALNDLNPRVRLGAIEILRNFDDSRIIDAVLTVSSNAGQEVRKAAITCLLSQTHPRAIEALVDFLGDESHSVWSQAAKSILKKGPQSLTFLTEALQHDKRLVRARAATLLCRPEIHKGATKPFRLTTSYIPYLLDALHDDPSYHPYLSRMLGQIKGDEFAQAMSLIYQGHSQLTYLLGRLLQLETWTHLSLLCNEIESLTKKMNKSEARSAFRVLKDTAKMQRKQIQDGFCTTHLARFVKQDHPSGIDYLGCRKCGSTLFGIRAPEVVLVLDSYMNPLMDIYPSSVYINALAAPDGVSIDFDRVEIGPCNRENIRELCMNIGNDTDTFRARKYGEMKCKVRRGATIGKEIFNLLSNQFAEVTYESDPK